MGKIIKNFAKPGKMDQTAYSHDNGKTWYWACNDRPCPLDSCKEHGIPCNAVAQKQAIQRHTEEFLAQYRAMQPSQPSAEEMFEAQAAFGPDVEVVDVFTGRRFRT